MGQPNVLAPSVCTMYINSADITYRILMTVMTLTNSGEASQIRVTSNFWTILTCFLGDQSAITSF